MGVFWDYFTEKLRFMPLLKTGAMQVLAEGGAGILDDVRVSVLWLRDQFLPELCDETFIDEYAASRGIAPLPYETREQFVSRVRFAWAWHIVGGREAVIDRIITEGIGIETFSIVNMRDVDPARWAEFRVDITNIAGNDLTLLSGLADAINRVKPARSRLAGIYPIIEFDPAAIFWGASGVFSGGRMTVFPFSVGELNLNTTATYGMVLQSGINAEILPA